MDINNHKLTTEDLTEGEMFCRDCGYIDTIDNFTIKREGTNCAIGEHVCPLCKHRQMFKGGYFKDDGENRMFRKDIYGPYRGKS